MELSGGRDNVCRFITIDFGCPDAPGPTGDLTGRRLGLLLASGGNCSWRFTSLWCQAKERSVNQQGRSIYLDPQADGIGIFMGPLEAILMELVWHHGLLTVKKALFYWPREPRPAYTTVMTTLTRLVGKGYLVRKKSGRSFQYKPILKREQFVTERIEQIQSALRHNFPRQS